MSIDKKIDDLISALDRNTSALMLSKAAGGSAPAALAKPAKPPKAPAKSEEQLVAEAQARVAATEQAVEEAESSGPTKEQAGAALQALLAANLKPAAIALLKKFKVASLSGLAESDYEAFIAEANEALLAA